MSSARRLAFMVAWSSLNAVAAQSSEVIVSPKVPDDARVLFEITTDAAEGSCELFAAVNAQEDLNGAMYHCSKQPDEYRVYSLDEVRKGITLGKGSLIAAVDPLDKNHRPAVVILSAPDLDAVQGGLVKAKYLTNGITSSYEDYFFTVERVGGRWATFTAADLGHLSFNRMFLKKKTAFGQVIGIKCVGVNWNGGPSTPTNCVPN